MQEHPRGDGSRLVRTRSVQSRVVEELRSALLAGEFGLGAHLPEAELAERLHVSRGPVREALRQLSEEGLVSFENGRGATVAGVRDDELDGVYRVAAVIEEDIFWRAAQRITDGDLSRLERIVDDMAHLVRMGDVIQTAEADIRFHALVGGISGLGLLPHMLGYLHRLSRFRTRQKLQQPGIRWDGWFAGMEDSHRALVEALRRRDPAAAAEAIRAHLYQLKEVSARDRVVLEPQGADRRGPRA